MIRHAIVTGGTGFFGSRLVGLLLEKGALVTVLARSTSDWRRLAGFKDRLVVRLADEPVESLFTNPVDIVVHTATCYGRRSEEIEQICETNYNWPLRLLKNAAARGVPWFINCDTSLPVGLNPYADWKAAFRTAAFALATDGHIGVLNMRLESLFGPGDDDTKFVMQLLHALLAGVPSFPMTSGEQSRDYLYVDDAVEAARVLIAALPTQPRGWLQAGVGSGEPIRVRDFAERLSRAVRPTVLDFGALPMREGELMNACADLTLLRSLGWQPRVPLDEAIARLVASALADATRPQSGHPATR